VLPGGHQPYGVDVPPFYFHSGKRRCSQERARSERKGAIIGKVKSIMVEKKHVLFAQCTFPSGKRACFVKPESHGLKSGGVVMHGIEYIKTRPVFNSCCQDKEAVYRKERIPKEYVQFYKDHARRHGYEPSKEVIQNGVSGMLLNLNQQGEDGKVCAEALRKYVEADLDEPNGMRTRAKDEQNFEMRLGREVYLDETSAQRLICQAMLVVNGLALKADLDATVERAAAHQPDASLERLSSLRE